MRLLLDPKISSAISAVRGMPPAAAAAINVPDTAEASPDWPDWLFADGLPLWPVVPVPVPVAAAVPPVPPLPDVVSPVVSLTPEVPFDAEAGSLLTAPELPVYPDLPEAALEVSVAGPE